MGLTNDLSTRQCSVLGCCWSSQTTCPHRCSRLSFACSEVIWEIEWRAGSPCHLQHWVSSGLWTDGGFEVSGRDQLSAGCAGGTQTCALEVGGDEP